jgi:hypothetical protein
LRRPRLGGSVIVDETPPSGAVVIIERTGVRLPRDLDRPQIVTTDVVELAVPDVRSALVDASRAFEVVGDESGARRYAARPVAIELESGAGPVVFEPRLVFETPIADSMGTSALPVIEWHGELRQGDHAAMVGYIVAYDDGSGAYEVAGGFHGNDRDYYLTTSPTGELVLETRDKSIATYPHGDGETHVDESGESGRAQPRSGRAAPLTKTVRVLFAYTTDTPSDRVTRINQGIASINSALITSGQALRLELATAPVAVSEAQGGTYMHTQLDDLKDPGDEVMDGLHTQRDVYLADIVALAVPDAAIEFEGGDPICGLADTGTLTTDESNAFAVVSVNATAAGCETHQHLIAHELGHLLGGAHKDENPSGKAFSWSAGHWVLGKGRTIMSYWEPCGSDANCPDLMQFSDPDVDMLGHPGTPSGSSTHDNDRSIRDVSCNVVGYRFPGWSSAVETNDSIWFHSGSAGITSVRPIWAQRPEYEPLAGNFVTEPLATRTDQFWYRPGAVPDALWTPTSTRGEFWPPVGKAVTGTYRPVVGDFDGDGLDDIFWHAPGTATDHVWWGAPSGADFGTAPYQSDKTVNGSYTPVAGDFNGDGYDDVYWYAAGSTPDYIWAGMSSRAGFGSSSVQRDVGGTFTPVSADFDGDGRDDLFWYAAGTPTDYLWWGQSTFGALGTQQNVYEINASYEPTVGNYTSGSRADLFWYRPGSGQDYIWLGQASRASFGSGNQLERTVGDYYFPQSGDYDGDGIDDVFWYSYG